MADTQSIIALNIGSQRISMGVFTTAKNNLVLKSYRATSILADPATEAARIPQVQLAIKELARKLEARQPEGGIRPRWSVGLHSLRQAPASRGRRNGRIGEIRSPAKRSFPHR